jgi:hypothetical protein
MLAETCIRSQSSLVEGCGASPSAKTCVCVCVCVRARARASQHTKVHFYVCVRACVCVCVCVRASTHTCMVYMHACMRSRVNACYARVCTRGKGHARSQAVQLPEDESYLDKRPLVVLSLQMDQVTHQGGHL